MPAADNSRQFDPRPVPGRRLHLAWSDPRLRNLVWQVVIVHTVLASGQLWLTYCAA